MTAGQILAVAERLADHLGFHQVTLALVAAKLGIRSPSLYNHIENLDGLRRELVLKGLREFHLVVLQATAGRSGDEAVRALCLATREFARRRPGLYEACQQPRPRSDREIHAATTALIEVSIAALSGYGLDERKAWHAMRVLRSATHGFITLERNDGFAPRPDIEESYAELIDWLLAGLRRGGRP